MSLFNSNRNPAGDGGQKDRVTDIRASFAAGELTQDQYGGLMKEEELTAKYIRYKRAGIMVLLATIGIFLLV